MQKSFLPAAAAAAKRQQTEKPLSAFQTGELLYGGKNIPASDYKRVVRPYRNANELNNEVLKLISLLGGKASRVNSTGIWDSARECWRKSNAETGIGDLVCCLNAVYIEIETKVRDRQSTDQRRHQGDVERAGGHYIIARSVDDVTQRLIRIFEERGNAEFVQRIQNFSS